MSDQEVTPAPEADAGNVPPSSSWDDIDKTMGEAFDKMNAPEDAEEVPVDADAAPVDGEAEELGAETAETEEAVSEALEAPDDWPPEMKDAFAKLSNDLRSTVAEWEKVARTKMHAKLSEQGRVISSLKPVNETLERYRHTYEARGLDANGALSALFEVQDRLDRDPVSAVQQIAQIYGVDLSQFGARPQDGQNGSREAPVDAQNAALKRELATLKQELVSIRNETAQERNSRETRELQETEARIAEWSKNKPHFEAARATMARLISSGEAAELDDAYEKAVWMNPDIRSEMEAAKAKQAAEKAAKEAEAAKKRQRVNVSKPGERTVPRRSWEDELGAVYDEVAARAG